MSEPEWPRSRIHTFTSRPTSPPPADMKPTMEKNRTTLKTANHRSTRRLPNKSEREPQSHIHTFTGRPASPPPAYMKPTVEKIRLEKPLPMIVIRNDKYYFEDEMSIFLVENQHFKVHRHFLIRESPVFQTMFTCPPCPDGPDGVSDRRPIPLPGVSSSEFLALLDFFYEGMKCETSQYLASEKLDPEAELQRQIDLLSISTRFDFNRVREAAIKCIRYGLSRRQDTSVTWTGSGDSQWLAGISPFDRISLAEKHDIPEWLALSYEDLCQRVTPLEVDEAEKLGVCTATLLARAREAVREKHYLLSGSLPFRYSRLSSTSDRLYDEQMVSCVVQEVFDLPSKEKKEGEDEP